MRSIPAAMTWELFVRGKWMLLGGFLVGMGLPIIILAALQHQGGLLREDKSWIIMHMTLGQICMVTFAGAVYSVQGHISRLYTFPARTETLVAWRLLPAMGAIFAASLLSTTIINFLFAGDWPLWGPAIFLAVAFAAVHAAAWLGERSAWMSIILLPIGVAFGTWFKSRYGTATGDPIHMWTEVTPAELLTMLATGLASYALAVYGVARNRRGEPPLSIGLWDWLMSQLDVARKSTDERFGSPIQAQLWFEWRRKGWLMPAGAVMLLCLGLIGWLFASRDGNDLFSLVVGGGTGAFFPLSIVVGFVMGLLGRTEASSEISQFLATRPIVDADWASIVLRTIAKSVFIAWSIWITAVVAVFAISYAAGSAAELHLPKEFQWWFFPGILLASWAIVGTGATIGLAGRAALFCRALTAGMVAIISYVLLEKFALSWPASRRLDEAAAILCGTALLALAGWAFITARRRGLISISTIWASATVWLSLVCVAIYLVPSGEFNRFRLEGYWVLFGAFTLAVLPLAAAPIAVAWNRHR